MNLGFPEMIFLFFLALIIFGPKKMPEIGRQIGKAINEFKRASNEFKSQIEAEISQLEVENHRQILPPTEPPHGTVTAEPPPENVIAPPENTMLPQLAGHSEGDPVTKGHDA
jgi:TatA/E family protein of Tat protein translocase